MKNYQKIIKDSLYEVNEPVYYNKWDCITYDFESKSLSKEKFDKKTILQEKLKPSIKFINKISKEHNGKKPRRPDDRKHYTKEQWARYYSRKRNSKRALQTTSELHKSEFDKNESIGFKEFTARGFDTLRTMPQINMDITEQRESENVNLLLSNNSYTKLQFTKPTDFTAIA